ncbi:MAG: RNA polymerase sigma factor [Mariniblastus sp.]
MSELFVNLPSRNAQVTSLQNENAYAKEEALMQRIDSGGQVAAVAIEELLQQHGEMLARLIGRLLAWHTDSDDVLQEVLLTVWKRAGSYRGSGSLEGWLKTIAINRCKNHFRKLTVLQRQLERFAILIGGQANLNEQSKTYSKSEDTQSQLSLALRKLTAKDRTAIVLFYLEEMPGNEVAEALGLKLDTFHVRLHRARKKLRHLLEEENE